MSDLDLTSALFALAGLSFYIQARVEMKRNLRRNASLVSLSAMFGKDMGTAWIIRVMSKRGPWYWGLKAASLTCWAGAAWVYFI